ncbi:MAG: hypothetical protein V4764_22025 [Burkholderia sp.]
MRDVWRANALIAAVAAMAAQLIVLLMMDVFHVPDRAFTSLPFHCAAVAYVAAAVLLAHRFAAHAFRGAVASGHVCLTSADERLVRVAAHCPRRALVLLHLRLHRYRVDRRPL